MNNSMITHQYQVIMDVIAVGTEIRDKIRQG